MLPAATPAQAVMHVSYLGPAGTYSEEAVRLFFGVQAQLAPASSTDEALELAEQGKVTHALLPIENSTEGAVSHTLDLLRETPLVICGEIALPIHHQLLGRAAGPEGVVAVIAHPQALAQCRRWLDENLPNADRQPAASNGEAAQLAAQNGTLLAIASTTAAKIYDLPILAQNIEDSPNNTTRFVALGRNISAPTGSDSTSLICTVPDRPGALLQALNVFAANGVNMTNLLSRPAPRALWRYIFYIDVDGHQADQPVTRSLAALHEQGMLVKVLGSYPKARRPA